MEGTKCLSVVIIVIYLIISLSKAHTLFLLFISRAAVSCLAIHRVFFLVIVSCLLRLPVLPILQYLPQKDILVRKALRGVNVNHRARFFRFAASESE